MAPPATAQRCLDCARREYENYAEGEVAEMIEIYVKKGFSDEDARKIIEIYTSKEEYKDAFLDHMMAEELKCIVPGDDETQVMCISSGITGVSFVTFGSLPLWLIVALEAVGGVSLELQIGLAAMLTVVSLFVLGIIKVRVAAVCGARVSGWRRAALQAMITRELTNAWCNGLLMMSSGALAAGAAFLVGMGANSLLSHDVVCAIRVLS